MAKQSKYSIVIPVGMKPRPKIHEETAADILANYFKSDVYFLETGSQGTPDVSIKGTKWEIKSPIGNSTNNIRKNMREAGLQSRNIVIDLRRSKLHQTRAVGWIYKAVHDHFKKVEEGTCNHQNQADIDNKVVALL